MLNPKKKLSQVDALTSVPALTRFVGLQTAAAQADPARRVATFTGPAVAEYLGANRGPNDRPDLLKSVQHYSSSSPGYQSGRSTLVDLDPLTCCQLTTVHVLYPGPAESSYYVPAYTPYQAGVTFRVHKDGRFNGDLTDATWQPADSDAAARANVREWDSAINDFYQDELITAPLGGRDAFFRVLTSGGPYPEPSGPLDAYYRQVAPPVSPTATFAALTQDEAIALLDDQQVARQRLYAITFPIATGRPDEVTVYIAGYDAATFNSTAALINPKNTETTIPVTVDVRAGTIVNIQASLEALSSPFYSSDPADHTKLIGFTRFENALEGVGNYSYVQIQTGEGFTLTRNVTSQGVTLYNKADVYILVPNGRTWSVNGQLRLNNVRIQVAAGGALTGLPSELRGGQLIGAYVFGATPQMDVYDAGLANATITGAGTLALWGDTFYSDAQITAAQAAGVTVIDHRPNSRVTTANDIEITDSTKGIIMTVGSTRVRARISGTAGARTWTFTDL